MTRLRADLQSRTTLVLGVPLPAGDWLKRIRNTSPTEVEKGRRSRELFLRLPHNEPAFEFATGEPSRSLPSRGRSKR